MIQIPILFGEGYNNGEGTGLVAIALCILPFILMHRTRKNKEKSLVSGLKGITATYNCEVACYDCGTEFAIGISPAKDYLFF